MKRILLLGASLFLCLTCVGARTASIGNVGSASAVEASPHAPELTKGDLDAWLDGFMPYALGQADMAGGAVVVVKDGRVLTQRGFGYADLQQRKLVDPETTLFRIGSISKLFTWTAVMQLQEKGKVDLDADVNRYLDFRIPPFEGRPVTLRELLTHTAGFEEAVKGGDQLGGEAPRLGDAVKQLLPTRVFAPGSTPAYSNYGAALAGYIVERVSGQSFEDYVQDHIFQPLGMKSSSTLQKLPAALAPLMSRGYDRASGGAKPFEVVSVPPAGGISASSGDMAKFMLANIAQGAGLMDPRTARLMQEPSPVIQIPGLNRMGLGYYQQRVNDLHAVGHGGDLRTFHSYMWLVPSERLGIYVALNSSGPDGASWSIRQALFEAFGDRYYPPMNRQAPRDLPTAKEHAQELAGNYVSQRAWFSNFMDVLNLIEQVHIEVDADGRPVVPDPLGGPTVTWFETAPHLWQDASGHQRLGAVVANGKVVRWSLDAVSPFMVWDRVQWYRDASWLLPSAIAAAVVLLVTALSWPIGAIARRRFGARLALTGSALRAHRVVKGAASLTVLALLTWTAVFAASDALADGRIDVLIWMAELLSNLAVVALVAAAAFKLWIGFAVTRTSIARLLATVFAASALIMAYVFVVFHLVTPGVAY